MNILKKKDKNIIFKLNGAGLAEKTKKKMVKTT